mmetsp:Transcript_56277/g.67802  ORF Transcript_56277/g.67802 Transcript_56277/m.67802 type:complete len:214 (+) Transcript_56277:44-685(+)
MTRLFLALPIFHICLMNTVTGFIPFLQRPVLKKQLFEAFKTKDASAIKKIVDELSALNPTSDIMKDFGMLSGNWKLEYTTAPNSEVPDEATSGVKTYQNIDTSGGVITNVIDRGLPDKGLKISVGAEPTRPGRVALDFRTIEAFNDKFPKKVVIQFPPRSFFRVISKILARLIGEPYDEQKFKEIAYFDLLFLDSDLRIQRNNEGNIFINSRI